jgi:hypothetical protein
MDDVSSCGEHAEAETSEPTSRDTAASADRASAPRLALVGVTKRYPG